MDDLTSYYAPPIHHPYYQPTPPPPPPGTSHQPPSVVSHPIHVQPQFVTYASPLYPQSSHDQLRTLFVAGLPEDVKPREIYNLFREFPGYQSSNLRAPISSNSQPFAFATFVDQQSAVMALHALSGMVFDLEKGSTLYIDLAKSNSRSKRHRSDDEGQSSEKRLKGSSTFERSYDPVLEVLMVDRGMRLQKHLKVLHRNSRSREVFLGEENHDNDFKKAYWHLDNEIVNAAGNLVPLCNYSTINLGVIVSDFYIKDWDCSSPSDEYSLPVFGMTIGMTETTTRVNKGLNEEALLVLMRLLKKYLMHNSVEMNDLTFQVTRGILSPWGNWILMRGLLLRFTQKNNTPCPTLFVANLGPTCSEDELMQVFSRCRGFIKLKMQSTYGAPVSFVDFQDTACSTEALNRLQGTILYSSTSGEGMRLEFARSRMGMRSKKSR